MHIYKITNKINNKCYIGQTVSSLQTRWSKHRSKDNKCTLVKQAIDKYGATNFIFEELETCGSIEELNFLEKYYIKHADSMAPGGYNLTSGGEGYIRSEENKAKMPKFKKGHTPWNKGLSINLRPNGYITSELTKKKIAQSKKGKRRQYCGTSFKYVNSPEMEK